MKANAIFMVSFLLLITSCNSDQKSVTNKEQIDLKQKHMNYQGVITKISSQNFEDTYTALVSVINNNPKLKIVAELDHHANAASVGLPLNPTRIIMFGNPNLGTPLMQSSPITGLDLPQKILVWQDDQGKVKVSYNDPTYLQERHNIEEKKDILQKVSSALDGLTNKAIGN